MHVTVPFLTIVVNLKAKGKQTRQTAMRADLSLETLLAYSVICGQSDLFETKV